MNNATYEILTEPFMHGDTEKVVYLGSSGVPYIDRASCFESDHFTLIREPKFKVGDRVTAYSDEYEIVAVSAKQDREGDFGYLCLDGDGYFSTFDDSEGIRASKAAE